MNMKCFVPSEHETNVNYYCQGGFTGERVKGRDLQVKGFTGREGN